MIRYPMLRARVARLAAFCAAAAAVASCGDATLPRGGAPDELEFHMGGFAATSISVELRGDKVVLYQVPWDTRPGTPVDSVVAVPSAEAWAAFWDVVADAGVTRWRRRYVAEGIVDGAGWTLRLAANGRVIESQGSNAYPDRAGREHEGESTPEFRAFRDAVLQLAGHRVF